YKLLRQLDLSTIYEIARDYVREMARDGSLDQLGDALEGVEIPDSVKKSFANSATEFVKNKLWDMLPKNLNYYLLAFAVIILTFALRGVGG
ncbi:MAG: hypothetical protein GOU99_00320, partial [Candidatus Altiarchaeota archaeon]|nr:hypothetical protein [Candidatus Altiarchaeota archaeon]